jgi:hypothetical protein
MIKKIFKTALPLIAALATHSAGDDTAPPDKFNSYRPYPYVFMHGRTSDALQWGFECSEDKEIKPSTVHPDGDGFVNWPNCRVVKDVWNRKGYAEALYKEFLQPGECNDFFWNTGGQGVRSHPKDEEGPIIHYERGTDYPPQPCTNKNFYVDFLQKNPHEKDESKMEELPAEVLPNSTWGPLLDQLPMEDWHQISFNHSFLEAYQGNGNKGGKSADREILGDVWGKSPTLVDIARTRITEVLDEYYQDANGDPNWACDTTKKVIMVGYSTGIAATSGVIYHDQQMAQEEIARGGNVKTWCDDQGHPTAFYDPATKRKPKAADLLSPHIAWVVGHNPVVAGSPFGPLEWEGKGYFYGGFSPYVVSTLFLVYTDLFSPLSSGSVSSLSAAQALFAEFKASDVVGSGLGALELFKAQDRLAMDLGQSSDYWKKLKGYGVPPTNVLAQGIPGFDARIKYKTIATADWAWDRSLDELILAYAAFTAIREFPAWPGSNAARFATSLVTLASGYFWWQWNHGTDFVLKKDEDGTSAKALNKDALIEHKVVHDLAHAGTVPVLFRKASYPWDGNMWDELRPFLFNPPAISKGKITSHKCVNHVGTADAANLGCDEVLTGGNTLQISKTTPIDKNNYLQILQDWKDLDGNPQQPAPVDLAGFGPHDVVPFSDGGGSPLEYILAYNSNLMATDKVQGYINGEYFDLKFRRDYGMQVDHDTHSGIVRVPLTKARSVNSDGTDRNPVWGDFESILQDGGNVIGFRGTNPAGTVIDRRLIYYDKRTVLLSINKDVKDGTGAVKWSPDHYNLSVFPFNEGHEDGGAPEIDNRGVLFAFRTDRAPWFDDANLDKVKLEVYATKPDGQIDRKDKVEYLLDAASLPVAGRTPIYNPYTPSLVERKVFLSPRVGEANAGLQPYQLFFWIKPDDLKRNKDASNRFLTTIEGMKHASLIVTKKPEGGATVGNRVFYQLEFGVDNTPPGPVKVFAPTLVVHQNGKSYADKNGDGAWEDDVKTCDNTTGLCDPGVDGIDNNGKGGIDDVQELQDINTYSQMRNERGDRINQGIHLRISLGDNMQENFPFTDHLRWRIIGPDKAKPPQWESPVYSYFWGTLFNDFCPFKDGEIWADGLYDIELEAYDKAGNLFKKTITQFVIDNTPPTVTLVNAKTDNWKGNQSGASGRNLSMLVPDSYASTLVRTDEEARIKIRLTPKTASSSIFAVNSVLSPLVPTKVGQPTPSGVPLLIYDNLDYLDISGFESQDKEKFYQKLPDGEYKVEVFATDKVGNVSPVAIPDLSTAGFDFIVDRTPPSINQLSFSPFLVPGGGQTTLTAHVSQNLDNSKTDKFQYTIKLGNTILVPATEGQFSGDFFERDIVMGPSVLALLSDGINRLVFEASEKDAQGLRNTSALSAVLVKNSWGISITNPDDGSTLTGTVPLAGRVGDPFVDDQQRFSGFKLSYVAGSYTDPLLLPTPYLSSGLKAVGSSDNEGHFEAPLPDNLGVWDTRVATANIVGKKGDFTLILEAFQADGKKKTALTRVHIDNSTTPPAGTTQLEFQSYTGTEAKFKLTGKPSQIVLSVFDASMKLVNQKKTIAAPLTYDLTYLPVSNTATTGVDAGSFYIRITPGDDAVHPERNNLFAFILKGFKGVKTDIQTRFYDKDGASISSADYPDFFTVTDGSLRYNPSASPFPVSLNVKTAELQVPISLLEGDPQLQFGNSLYELLNPTKAAQSPYLPAGSIFLGASKIPAVSNPFSYNLTPVVTWKQTDFLGEEVEAGNYTLQMEAFTLDGKEYCGANPLTLPFTKTSVPKLKIANARVAEDVVTPLSTADAIKAKASLSFSMSRSANVTINLYKDGQVAPVQQVAGNVLLAGGYGRLIDLFGIELTAGNVSFEEGAKYYFRIVAVSSSNSSDMCVVSPYENSCYDADAGAALKLDFTIGKVFSNANFWDGKDTPPFILTSRPGDAFPADPKAQLVVAPVSDIHWKVDQVAGNYYQPIKVKYKIKKKGIRKNYTLGYDFTMAERPDGRVKTEWNYVREIRNHFIWGSGGNVSRYFRVAARKDFRLGETMQFLGPSIWAKDVQDPAHLTMDLVRNGGTTENRDDGAPGGDWFGNCKTETKGHCYDVEESPAAFYNFEGNFHPIAPHPGLLQCANPTTNWEADVMFRSDTELDGFLQAGHWNSQHTTRNGGSAQYSEQEFRYSFDDAMEFQNVASLNLNVKRPFSSVEYADPGDEGKLVLSPNTPLDIKLNGTSSLRHARYKKPIDVAKMFIGNDDDAYIFTYSNATGSTQEMRGNVPWTDAFGWGSSTSNDYPHEDPDFPDDRGACQTIESKDYFLFNGHFYFKGQDGTTIPVFYVMPGKLEGRGAFLGDGTEGSGPVKVFTDTWPVTNQLGSCAGSLGIDLFWEDELKPYTLRVTWHPTPGCADAPEKIAESAEQEVELAVSPFGAMTSPKFGTPTKDNPYARYMVLDNPRASETHIDQAALVQSMIASQLSGYTPVDWVNGQQSIGIEITGVTGPAHPDGSPMTVADVETLLGPVTENTFGLRVANAAQYSKPLSSVNWGAFQPRTFNEPDVFDSWKPVRLEEGYCQAVDQNGLCTVADPSTPADHPTSLFHKSGNLFAYNNDIQMTQLRATLLNDKGEEHPQLQLFPAAIWKKSSSGYDLQKENLYNDPAFLSIDLNKGVMIPQRFVTEKKYSAGQISRDKYVDTYFEWNSKFYPIRASSPGDALNPMQFNLGAASGPILHVTKTFSDAARTPTSLERMDMRTFLIGRELNLNSASSSQRTLASAFKRVIVQYQNPGDPKYDHFIADVVPVDLQTLALKYSSASIPQLDQMIAPAFSLYPDLLNFKDFPGKEPTVTYYLRKDEVTDPADPSRSLSATNLTRLYALNPASGELRDMTAFITLIKRVGGTDQDFSFQFKACLETPGNNPSGALSEEQACLSKTDFGTALQTMDWDYIRLIAQPRIFAAPVSQPVAMALSAQGSSSPAAAASDPDLGIQQQAFLPLFEKNTSTVSLSVPPKSETVLKDLTLQGALSGSDGTGAGFETYEIEYGYGLADQYPSFQSLKDAGRIHTAMAQHDGTFALAITNLDAGRNVVLARISKAGTQQPSIATVARGEITYVQGGVSLVLAKSNLVSNLEIPDVTFTVTSPVSGALSIDIFTEAGEVFASLSGTAVGGVPLVLTWNPSNIPGIESHHTLPFTATVTQNIAGSAASASGSILIDYTTPKLTISSVESQQENVLIRGTCQDGLHLLALGGCDLFLENLDGFVIKDVHVIPENSGTFEVAVPSSEMGERVANHDRFKILLSGQQESGNQATIVATATFEFKDEPVIVPSDLTASAAGFTPVVGFPSGKTGEFFQQGEKKAAPGPLTQDGLYTLSAATTALGKVTASNVHNVLLDKTPPVLGYIMPANGSVIHSPYHIDATVTDPNLLYGVLAVSGDGGSANLRMTVQGEVLHYAVENFGHYRVSLSGEDLAGNRVEKVSEFDYDKGAAIIATDFANNDFVPVVNGMAELRWSVEENHAIFDKAVVVSLNGASQPVVYTDYAGRAASVTHFVTKVPVSADFNGSGQITMTVKVPGETDVTLSKAFRISQTGPVVIFANPTDNSQVQRKFNYSFSLTSDVGFDVVELTLPDGVKRSSGPLNGPNDFNMFGVFDYQGVPLNITMVLFAKDKLGHTLQRTFNYTVFDFQVLAKDNSLWDTKAAKPQVKVYNLSQTPLQGMTVRFWLSREEAPWKEVVVDPFVSDPCGISLRVSVHPSNANVVMVDAEYPQGFVLAAGAQTPDNGLQFGLHYKNGAGIPWVRSNDYSWQGISGAYSITRNVTVYDGTGKLIYGTEPNLSTVPQPPAPPAPDTKQRVTAGLQALYFFHEGYGPMAADISEVGVPLNLKFVGNYASWVSTGGVEFTLADHNSFLENRIRNSKLYTSSTASDKVSLETWMETGNLSMDAARLIQYGPEDGTLERNWDLLQYAKNIEFRLRTSAGKTIALRTTNNPIAAANTVYHVVATYEAYNASTGKGGMRIYVNGVLSISNQEAGTLDATGTNAWTSSYTLALGNRPVNLDKDWQGKMYMMAVFSTALSQTDVSANYVAGIKEPAIPSAYGLGLACGENLLPYEITQGKKVWQENKTADNGTITMGGIDYLKGLGGQPKTDATSAWLAYDLTGQKGRLGISGAPLRVTGFGGKQDGSGSVDVFVKTSANSTKPTASDWLANSGGVLERFRTSNGSNAPFDVNIESANWLLVGVNATAVASGLNGVLAEPSVHFTEQETWKSIDIGNTALPGAFARDGETFTVKASGDDIWVGADAFRFTYKTLNGDGQIIARLASIQNTDPNAKAGVMIRQSLESNSPNATAATTYSSGSRIQYRTTAGGSTSKVSYGTGSMAPQWLKLVRQGNVFTASTSEDGLTWVSMGTTTIAMPAAVYIGMAVTSHNNAQLNTSVFDNVVISGVSSPALPVEKLGNYNWLHRDNWDGSSKAYNGIAKVGGYMRGPSVAYDDEALVKFDVTGVPLGKKATFRFKLNGGNSGGDQSVVLYNESLRTSWNPSTVTYDTFCNSLSDCPSWVGNLGSASVNSASPGWLDVTSPALTQLVNNWIANPTSNQGVVLTGNFWYWGYTIDVGSFKLIVE